LGGTGGGGNLYLEAIEVTLVGGAAGKYSWGKEGTLPVFELAFSNGKVTTEASSGASAISVPTRAEEHLDTSMPRVHDGGGTKPKYLKKMEGQCL